LKKGGTVKYFLSGSIKRKLKSQCTDVATELRAARRTNPDKPVEQTPETRHKISKPTINSSPSAKIPDGYQFSMDLLHELEWKRFEQLVEGYFARKGWRTRPAPIGADGGVDIHLFHPDSQGVAAVYHGAAHQRPETYHIVTSRAGTRKLSCGNLVIRFFRKKYPENTLVQMIKCPAGYIPVSTPEETAFDILSYSSSIGGLDRVLTVLKELCEKIDPSILLKVAKKENCISLAQRLGWLIYQTDFGDRTDKLAEWIKRKNPRHVKLDFHLSSANSKKDGRWNVCVNTTVESDIQ